MKSQSPKKSSDSITIVLPNYNDSKFLTSAITQYLHAMSSDDTLLIIDDGSTDDSLEIIKTHQKTDPRVHLIRCEKNGGVLTALNRGLAETRTDLVYFGSTNDPIEHGLFDAAKEAFHQFPEAGLYCGDCWLQINDEGYRLPIRPSLSHEPRYLTATDYRNIMERLERDMILPSPAVVVRTATMREVGGYRAELNWHSDWFAFHVLALRYGLYYDPVICGTFVLNPQSFSHVGLRSRSAKDRLILGMLNTLNTSSFDDVREGFRSPFVLACFYNMRRTVVRLSLFRPRYWWILSWDLVRQAIMDVARIRVWPLVWKMLSHGSNAGVNFLRMWVLCLFGAKIGKNVVIDKQVAIEAPWFLKIGDNTRLGKGVTIRGRQNVDLGRDVCVDKNVEIITETMNMDDSPPTLITGSVTLGDHVQVDENEKVLPFTHIPAGSIISSREKK